MGNTKRQHGKAESGFYFRVLRKKQRVVIHRIRPNCTQKFKSSQLKLTLWNGTEVRVERIRHAFQTTAPEPACEANTVQSTKGQEAPLTERPSFDQESGQLAQNTNVEPSCTVTPRQQSQSSPASTERYGEFENLSMQGQISLQLRLKWSRVTRNEEEHP